MKPSRITIPILFSLLPILGFSQQDSVVFNSGEYLIGEVKEMDKGVVKMKTSYSKSDFTFEWKKIREIYSKNTFLITLTDGTRFEGSLESVNDRQIRLFAPTEELLVRKGRIVQATKIKDGFSDRFSAALSLGYTFTRADNQQQFTVRSTLGYAAERWNIIGSFNAINTTQDRLSPNVRREADISFRYFLPKDWYLIPQVSTLSNTEQNLNIRVSTKLGVGKFVIHTNRTYWGFNGGLNINYESITRTDTSETMPESFKEFNTSAELFVGTEVNIFDVKNLDLNTQILAYPSLTIRGRWRVDYSLDVKYELPLDFYIQLGTTVNFDNQAENRTDFVIQSTFGWSW